MRAGSFTRQACAQPPARARERARALRRVDNALVSRRGQLRAREPRHDAGLLHDDLFWLGLDLGARHWGKKKTLPPAATPAHALPTTD